MISDRAIRRWKRLGEHAVLLLAVAALLTVAAAPRAVADLLADGAAAYDTGDYGEAAHIWLPLAEGGDRMAQFNMGLLYESGLGVPLNHAQAAAWYERAALQGVTRAQYNLAVLHQAGRGVPQDSIQALYWLEVAARHGKGAGRQQAADVAERLASLLAADEVEAIRARASAFAPRRTGAPAGEAATLILSQHQIEILQRRLAAQGYDPGPPDGIPGEQTRSAVRRYLADRGLAWPEGGHLTQGLLELIAEP